MKRKLFLCLIFSILVLQNTFSNPITLSDSAKVSVLIDTPWQKEVYAIFGHAQMRISDPSTGIDLVFNYGLFDFDAPNFIYRFVKGQTDYLVGADRFMESIQLERDRGIGVTEQVLNLRKDEKQKIWNALCINLLPENREYRYNFFFDNCATRPRNIIENNIDGKISYTPTNKKQTFRDLLDECTVKQLWVRFGIDLVIGGGADREATDREKMFLPFYLQKANEGAFIIRQDGSKENLVLVEHTLLPNPDASNSSLPTDYPLIVGCILLLITICISLLQYFKKTIFVAKVVDFLLFLTYALAGTLISFMVLFSTHPCVSPNWNLFWLNPFMFIVPLLSFVKVCSKFIYYYHFINFAVLLIFLLLWVFIPQRLEIAFVPYILAILLRSMTNVLQVKGIINCTKSIK